MSGFFRSILGNNQINENTKESINDLTPTDDQETKKKTKKSFILMGIDGHISYKDDDFDTFDQFVSQLSAMVEEMKTKTSLPQDGDNTKEMTDLLAKLVKSNTKQNMLPLENDKKADEFDHSYFDSLTSVGDSTQRSTFVPLFYRGISLNNPPSRPGMSQEYFARQYCDISSNEQIVTLDMTSWINVAFLKQYMLETALNPVTDQHPRTATSRVHVLKGTYLHNFRSGQNVLASVFLRHMQTWLNEYFGQDEQWKQFVVFDDDGMGYTVY